MNCMRDVRALAQITIVCYLLFRRSDALHCWDKLRWNVRYPASIFLQISSMERDRALDGEHVWSIFRADMSFTELPILPAW